MTEGQVRGGKKKERHGQGNSLHILPPPDRPLLAARMLEVIIGVVLPPENISWEGVGWEQAKDSRDLAEGRGAGD